MLRAHKFTGSIAIIGKEPELPYERPPLLKGHFADVQGVRTRADADAMKAASETADQIVVIGGGYIGLGVAAVLRKAGKKVVLLEAQGRVLARVAGEEQSRFYEKEHRDHGAELRRSLDGFTSTSETIRAAVRASAQIHRFSSGN